MHHFFIMSINFWIYIIPRHFFIINLWLKINDLLNIKKKNYILSTRDFGARWILSATSSLCVSTFDSAFQTVFFENIFFEYIYENYMQWKYYTWDFGWRWIFSATSSLWESIFDWACHDNCSVTSFFGGSWRIFFIASSLRVSIFRSAVQSSFWSKI